MIDNMNMAGESNEVVELLLKTKEIKKRVLRGYLEKHNTNIMLYTQDEVSDLKRNRNRNEEEFSEPCSRP